MFISASRRLLPPSRRLPKARQGHWHDHVKFSGFAAPHTHAFFAPTFLDRCITAVSNWYTGINKMDTFGMTPLCRAAYSSPIEACQTLLRRGANPNKANANGMTPLYCLIDGSKRTHHQRSDKETLEMARLLLAHGADPNQADHNGTTPLELAHQKNKEMVWRLVELGADPHLLPENLRATLLHTAATQGRTEAVRILLEKGTDPDQMAHGFSSVYQAAYNGHPDVVRLLLDHGADPNLAGENTPPPLYGATISTRAKAEAIRLLLDKDAQVNQGDRDGYTPLYWASETGKTEAVQWLLEKGADPNLTDSMGTPPLQRAAVYGHTEIVRLLLEKGANPNQTNRHGNSPLSGAAFNGHTAIVQLLLEKGADPALLSPSQQFYFKAASPADFLEHVIRHAQDLTVEDITLFYAHVEFQYPIAFGKNLLPELLALLPLYARKVSGQQAALNTVSSALTRLYEFTTESAGGLKIEKLLGIALRNWGEIGTLGLSFSRWKFDAMDMWRGAGPSAKPPLLVQSGLFKPTPARADDDRYFRGFVHYDPTSGLSIELRRAYIVISKPGSGSLVIRNSSHHFGRDLFPEPAYHSAVKNYTQGTDLLNPADLFKPERIVYGNGDYLSVLGKAFNRSVATQELNHGKIKDLLTAFEGVMEQYTQWKSGFHAGKAPEGLKGLLEAAVASTASGGVMSPFGKHKNVRLAPRLAWINPYELPAPVTSLDLSQPEVLKEAELYLKVLKGQAVIKDAREYGEKLPKLMAFLAEGARQGLELVLVS